VSGFGEGQPILDEPEIGGPSLLADRPDLGRELQERLGTECQVGKDHFAGLGPHFVDRVNDHRLDEVPLVRRLARLIK
jgi:hypothetical protein